MQTFTIGRAVFAVPMAIFGIFHFLGAEDMVGMVPVPGGLIWVYLTGAALIAAAIAILTKKLARIACQLLALLLLAFALTVHLPQLLSATAETMQGPMVGMLKDISLAGAAFALSGTFQKDGDG